MGLPKPTTAQDELFLYGWEFEPPEESQRSGIDELFDDTDPTSAASGTVLGVFFGGIIWAVILGLLL